MGQVPALSHEEGPDMADPAAGSPAPEVAVLRLTRLQADEVEHGMSIDADDGNPDWGWIERSPGKQTVYLHVTNLDRAVYRLTSSRDIWRDNAAVNDCDRREYLAGARSLDALIGRLVKTAGGPESVSLEYRRWL